MIDEAAKRLRVRLGQGATKHARSAMECYLKRDGAGFYLHAGTALEMALKARLLTHGLFAIAPNQKDWFKLALALMKNPDAASARTVGGRDALARLLELEPDEHLHLHGAVHDTVDRWNQVKHLGLAEEPTPEQLLAHAASFGRVVNALLRAPADDFWGPLYGLVTALVAEELSIVSVRVEEKLTKAREHMGMLGPDRVGDLAKVALEAIEAESEEEYLGFAERACPVCGSPGRAIGETIDDGDVDVDADKYEVNYFWAYDIVTIAVEFKCEVCGLHLTGGDELDAAEVSRRVQNDRVLPETMHAAD